MLLYITLLLPLLIINALSTLILYACIKECRDKYIPLIVITAIEIVLMIVVAAYFNKLGWTVFAYWLMVNAIVWNNVHLQVSHDELLPLDKKTTALVTGILSSVTVFLLFYGYAA